MQDNFFEESREPSQVKARIVEKYFSAWADVIIGDGNRINRIGYVDFFAGPGNMRTKRNLHHFLSLKKRLTVKKYETDSLVFLTMLIRTLQKILKMLSN